MWLIAEEQTRMHCHPCKQPRERSLGVCDNPESCYTNCMLPKI